MYAKNALRYDMEDRYYYYNAVTMPAKPKKQRIKPAVKPKPKKKKGKNSLFSIFIALTLLTILGILLTPVSFNLFTSTFFPDRINFIEDGNVICSNNFSPEGGLNLSGFIHPTLSYTSNYTFLNKRIDYIPTVKNAQMSTLKLGDRLTDLENSLKIINQKYSNIKPSVFVWSMDNNNYASIDSTKIYPAASIIKLPVLIQLYKTIEAEKFGLKDYMYLTEYYRSSGSGNMQYSQAGRSYSVYELAKVMIQDSDNTATNMLISKIGSMNDINAALRNWGIKHTHMQTWLPDLGGTNYTTAEDMAQMLYNIGNDDNKFLNINSQSDIIDIMGKVKNVNLIKAGLPANVDFIHKTGDIGTMLGDAGIVYLPSGQRYIVVILAKRPHNHVNGKLYIQEASKAIYNYMSTRN